MRLTSFALFCFPYYISNPAKREDEIEILLETCFATVLPALPGSHVHTRQAVLRRMDPSGILIFP
jgi:hypothetical protein